ncbi:hypothetical protein GCM10010468_02010 [Actinocorallia longicatena]|uniref:Ankyrin repeat protein n=1 Tax=Actinocorallia longicatena TaxID=111803 RepID=A0ABP6PYD1_9ACTN
MRTDACFPPDELASWVAVRRYAVPAWMIEKSAARREAGDWRGACEAANVDVEFDLAKVAAEHGEETARALEADLLELAPDLLRWHLPRILHGHSALSTDRTFLLSGTDPWLQVRTRTIVSGTQRLRLLFDSADDATNLDDWTDARHLWSAPGSAGLRERIGGTPFLRADGTAETTGSLAERVILAQEDGRTEEAWELAGVTLDRTVDRSSRYVSDLGKVLQGEPINIPVLADEIRRAGRKKAWLKLHWATAVELRLLDDGGMSVAAASADRMKRRRALPEALFRRLPDLDLLRHGAIGVAELHPLVVASLFPGYDGPVTGPPGPGTPAAVRVRCKEGAWHEMRGGVATAHAAEERRREQALKALGGKVTGCFAVEEHWRGQEGRLPRGLRAQRKELFARAQHGDEAGVLALLEAGLDPRARDGRDRTLLHYLPCVNHTELLPLLLKAGVDLEANDQEGRTPLLFAVGHAGPEALVRALIDAGARTDCTDDSGRSLRHLVRLMKRYELRFLYDQVSDDIGEDWYGEYYDEDDDYDWDSPEEQDERGPGA